MLNLRQKQATYSNTNTADDAVHQYIDVDVVNNLVVENNGVAPMVPQPLIFNQIKLNNIVDNCSDYYLSVIRWQMDSSIPQIIPQIPVYPTKTPIAYETNGLMTVYGLSFSYGEFPNSSGAYIAASKQHVLFSPDDLSIPPPKYYPQTQEENYLNPYYHIYTVQSFLDRINAAIVHAYDALPSDIKTENLYPKFVWNSSNNKIEYLVTKDFVYSEGSTKNVFLNVNTALYNLLDTFSFKCVNPTKVGDTNYNSYSLFLYDQNQRFSYGYDKSNESVSVYIYTQDSSSVPSWSPCNSIQFNTATIPVNPSATSAPLYLGDNQKTSLAASAQSNIITDFQIPLITGTEMTGQLYYAPAAEYRLFDLVTNGALQQLNIEVTWLDKLGNGHQFMLKNWGNASIKIMLRKKSF